MKKILYLVPLIFIGCVAEQKYNPRISAWDSTQLKDFLKSLTDKKVQLAPKPEGPDFYIAPASPDFKPDIATTPFNSSHPLRTALGNLCYGILKAAFILLLLVLVVSGVYVGYFFPLGDSSKRKQQKPRKLG